MMHDKTPRVLTRRAAVVSDVAYFRERKQPGVFLPPDEDWDGKEVFVIQMSELPKGIAIDPRSGVMRAKLRELPHGWEFKLDHETEWRSDRPRGLWDDTYSAQVRPPAVRKESIPWHEARGRQVEDGTVIEEVGKDHRGPWFRLEGSTSRNYVLKHEPAPTTILVRKVE